MDNFSRFTPIKEPSAGLFDRIILAIKKEKELRQTRKLLIGFFLLLAVSFVATPLSFLALKNQIDGSGVLYLISAAASDLRTFFSFWQIFSLAILESVPIMEIVVFMLSIGIVLFTLRLFLHKRRMLLDYLIKGQLLTI